MTINDAKKKKKNWVQKAIKNPGSLTKKAKRTGMSVAQYCKKKHKDPSTNRQCNLYKTLKKMNKKRKRRK